MKTDIPAVLNLQVNGRNGQTFTGPERGVEEVASIMAANFRRGVIPVPTIVTARESVLLESIAYIREWYEKEGIPRNVGKMHLECFGLSTKEGARGAHDHSVMLPATCDILERFIRASGDRIGVITLALDSEGEPLAVIREAAKRGISVLLGHQDIRECDEGMKPLLRKAIRAGARGFTHFGNAMPAVQARSNPLFTYLALANPKRDLVFTVIADGAHASDSAMQLVFRLAGPRNFIVIADDSRFAHYSGEGQFEVSPGRFARAGEVRNYDLGTHRHAVVLVDTATGQLAGSWYDGRDTARYITKRAKEWRKEGIRMTPKHLEMALFYNPLRLLHCSVDEMAPLLSRIRP